MGGLLHIFEFNQGRMAKKVHAHKRHHGGLEAPRNSLDLQVETSQSHCPDGELPYYYQVEEDWSENNRYSNVGSMKKLINEELSKRSGARHNAPSLVARLMGIDMMPLDTKPVVPSDKRTSENMGKKFSKKGMNGRSSVGWSSSNFYSSSPMHFDSFYDDIDDDGWNQNFGEPRPREHPQEAELQKFKREFEAYQAARFLECSKVVEIGGASRQLLAQENPNKEKVAHNASSQRAATEKPAELANQSFRTELPKSGGLEYRDDIIKLIPAKQKEFFPSRSRTLSRDFEESLMMKSSSRFDKSSSPTRIVILKPGPDSICNHEENCTSSSGTLQGRNSIEDFLEEVRERLKCELQGKSVKKGSVVRGSGIETPYNEKPSDPKLIARHIAKQVRETVTREAETNLLRSELTRPYKSEIQFNGPSSPESVNRDTRRFLSERLRNVVKSGTYLDIPEVNSRNSRSYELDNHRDRLKQTGDIMNCANDMSHWEISKEEKEIQTGSFRHEPDDNMLLHRELSPRNLVRSLSAPVSGTSFGKLLLEDRHVVTGAHIQRKLEAGETMPVDVKKRKKDRFSIKEKVSNFKYSLSLRGKLFGKRIQSMVESCGNENGPMVRDITSGPTVLMNYGESERHENSTEVPPSPASVCSNSQEELWRRTEYTSPISTPEVASRDDDIVPQVFRDISSDLNELRKQLSQLESDGPEDFTTKQEPVESELVQLQDPAESYVRDLLVASGLYFGSWDKSLLRGDTFAKPIGNSVFEEVEESHKKLVKENESSTKDQNQNKLEHKLLLDLLNEALSSVLGPPLTLSRFRRKLSNSSMLPPPCGKELLNSVWDIIRFSLYPPSDMASYSLDSLVAQDLGSISWSRLTNDEINILERDIEYLITDDLVEEITQDMPYKM